MQPAVTSAQLDGSSPKYASLSVASLSELFHFRIANCFKKWHKNGIKRARNPSKSPPNASKSLPDRFERRKKLRRRCSSEKRIAISKGAMSSGALTCERRQGQGRSLAAPGSSPASPTRQFPRGRVPPSRDFRERVP